MEQILYWKKYWTRYKKIALKKYRIRYQKKLCQKSIEFCIKKFGIKKEDDANLSKCPKLTLDKNPSRGSEKWTRQVPQNIIIDLYLKKLLLIFTSRNYYWIEV